MATLTRPGTRTSAPIQLVPGAVVIDSALLEAAPELAAVAVSSAQKTDAVCAFSSIKSNPAKCLAIVSDGRSGVITLHIPIEAAHAAQLRRGDERSDASAVLPPIGGSDSSFGPAATHSSNDSSSSPYQQLALSSLASSEELREQCNNLAKVVSQATNNNDSS